MFLATFILNSKEIRMNQFWQNIKTYFNTLNFRKIIKRIGFLFLGIVALLLIASVILSVYFNNHKTEIVTQINAKINESISGTVGIGDINYKFLKNNYKIYDSRDISVYVLYI